MAPLDAACERVILQIITVPLPQRAVTGGVKSSNQINEAELTQL
jgi:hypothetical protein